MKNGILLAILLFTHLYSVAQNFCSTGGAQGSTLGATDCYPYASSCSGNYNAEILLILKTDHKAQETSWEVKDMTDNVVIASRGSLSPDSTYKELICAKTDHCYRFVIYDSGLDGIDTVYNRGYFVYWNGNLKTSGGNFGESDTTTIGACCNDFSIKLVGDLPCTSNAAGQAHVEIFGGTPPFDYLWSNGATFTETQFITVNDDQIAIKITDASNCVAETELEVLQTTPIIIATTKNEGGEIRLNVSGGAGQPYFYEWYNIHDKNMIISNSKDLFGIKSGNYEVRVTDILGCSVTNAVMVHSSGQNQMNDGLEDRINLTPNPTHGAVLLKMNLKDYHEVQIEVYDFSGKKIIAIPLSNTDIKSFEFDFSKFPSGVFIFRILIDQEVITKKLIYTK